MADPATVRAALSELEITIRTRVDGLLHGNHLGLVPGPGGELGEARPYVPGDDVRRMDWAVTARTTVPHVRQTIADRELETWLAIDLSASMDFGTANCEKRDLAIVAAAVFAQLTSGGGNRIGAVLAGARLARIPPRAGREATLHLLNTIAQQPRTEPGQRGDLTTALEDLRRPERRRGLVVAVSDFLGPLTWVRPLRALAARHDVIAVRILDPRDVDLPAVGLATLLDPETGRRRRVRITRALAEKYGDQATAHGVEVEAALRGMGVSLMTLRTDRDWVSDVLRFVIQRKRGWSGSASPRELRVATS